MAVSYKKLWYLLVDKKMSKAALICTPKVRHFWRCIFLWQKKERYRKNTRQNSK